MWYWWILKIGYHNKLMSIDKKDKKEKIVGRVGCFVIQSGRGGGKKKTITVPDIHRQHFWVVHILAINCLFILLHKKRTVLGHGTDLQENKWSFSYNSNEPVDCWTDVEKRKYGGGRRVRKTAGSAVEMRNFCCWNQHKCLWLMSALKRWVLMSFFLCVWDYGGCRSVRSRNMQEY